MTAPARAGGVVRMRGLPFSACSSDVISFFQAVPTLDKERIYFAYDGTGRPSGEAYAVFTGTDGFNAAMKLQKHKMGPRYIELFASSSSELQRLAKQKKLRADTGHGRTRALVATKDVELKSVAAPRVSAVRGEPTSHTTSRSATPSQDARPAPPRTKMQSFASVAAASVAPETNTRPAPTSPAIDIPVSNGYATAGDGASAGAPATAARVPQGHTLQGHTSQGHTSQGHTSQGHMSGANSGTSSIWASGGQRGYRADGEKVTDWSMDHSSESSSWQNWGAGLGVYDMWADHTVLPKTGYIDSPPKGPYPEGLFPWEPAAQTHGFQPTGTFGQ